MHNELQNQIKPKETNKSHSSPRSDDEANGSLSGKPDLSADSPSDYRDEGLRPCNGLNDCKYSNNNSVDARQSNGSDSQLNKPIDKLTNEGLDRQVTINEKVATNAADQPTKCNQNGSCCALFAVFAERQLIKGQRFGPYLVDRIESKIESEIESKVESNKPNNLKEDVNSRESRENRDDSEDSSNELAQIKGANQAPPEAKVIQVQEPAGFWLKVVRTSSNPTACIRIQGEPSGCCWKNCFSVLLLSNALFLEFSRSSRLESTSESVFSLKLSVGQTFFLSF